MAFWVDGDAWLHRVWEAIDGARRRVWLEVYTLAPDPVGLETLARLAAAAHRGCEVVLVVDAIGSSALWEWHTREARAAGIRVLVFNPIRLWRWRRSWLLRDHRKLLIIDDSRAFTGGRNFGVRYGGAQLGEAPFYDLAVEVEGPALIDLAAAFAETLAELKQPIALLACAPEIRGPYRVQVLASNPGRRRRTLQRQLRLAVGGSRRQCLLVTPYLLPSLRLLYLLRRQARRGVRVTIITAYQSDVRLVDWARAHIQHRLTQAGVEVFEYPYPLHAKALVCDDELAWVGSFNMDRFTERHVLELGVAVHDARFAGELRLRLETDLLIPATAPATDARKRPWWQKLRDGLAYWLLDIRAVTGAAPVAKNDAQDAP